VVSTDPSTATPKAPPSSRLALFIAEPMPARAGGTAAIISVVRGAPVAAMPNAVGTSAAATIHAEEPASSWARSAMPTPTRASPPATTTRVPKRATTFGTCGVAVSMMSDTGSCTSPAASADTPSTSCRNCATRKKVPNSVK